MSCFFEIRWGFPNKPVQKGYTWASFQIPRKTFGKLQEAIWLTVINEIFVFAS